MRTDDIQRDLHQGLDAIQELLVQLMVREAYEAGYRDGRQATA